MTKVSRFLSCRLAGAVLLGAALLAQGGCSKHQAAATLESAPVKRGNIVRKVTATGSLSAVVSVDVGSQISGTIQKLFADYNSPVTNGQVVALIDPAIYQANVHQAHGDLDNAKAALDLAVINEQREKKLLAEKLVSQSDYDQMLAALHQAQATVEIKQAALDNAQANLRYCTIRSPIDGVVIARKLDVGQTVAASFNTPVLFTIANDLTKMHIEAAVSEADIGQVRIDQAVQFTVDAFPDESFEGRVAQVRKAPMTNDNVVTYSTIIQVDNPAQKLFPGMTAEVSLLVAERKNALRIPNSALRVTPPDGVKCEGASPEVEGGDSAAEREAAKNQRLVYAPAGTSGEPRLRVVRIRVGISDGAYTEVLEGVKEGDLVVTAAISSQTKSSGAGGPPPQ